MLEVDPFIPYYVQKSIGFSSASRLFLVVIIPLFSELESLRTGQDMVGAGHRSGAEHHRNDGELRQDETA